MDFSQKVSAIFRITKKAVVGTKVEPPYRDLIDILVQFWSFNATNPKDKVYALLNLTKTKNITVEYSDSFSIAELFKDVSFKLISESRKLDILTISNCARVTKNNLPSWAPDWVDFDGQSMGYQLNPKYNPQRPFSQQFTASKDSSSPLPIVNSNTLTLSGYLIDQIVEIGPSMCWFNRGIGNGMLMGFYNRQLHFPDDQTDSFLHEVSFQRLDFTNTPNRHPRHPHRLSPPLGRNRHATSPSIQHALPRRRARVLSGPQPRHMVRWRRRRPEDHGTLPRLAPPTSSPCASRAWNRPHPASREENFFAEERDSFDGSALLTWRNYAIARTARGLLALVPGTARNGDEVALVKGGDLPFVVRRTTGG